MLMTSFTSAFAAVSVDKEKASGEAYPTYSMGDTITITTDEYEAIKVFDSNNELLVWGASEKVGSEWQYTLKLPEETDNDTANSGFWKAGVYTVYAGNNSSTDSCKFEITDNSESGNGKMSMYLAPNSKAYTNTWKNKLVTFKYATGTDGYKNSDTAWINSIKVTKNGSTVTNYDVRFNGITLNSNMPYKTNVGNMNTYGLDFKFKATGTYYIVVEIEDNAGNVWDNTMDSTTWSVKVINTSSGGSSGGGGGSSSGSTWIPGIEGANTASGIDVRLNPSQETAANETNKLTYTSTLTGDSFTIGVAVNGVNTTYFPGYDSILVKVPYKTNLTDNTTLVVKDANGNIMPRCWYKDGYMYVNVKSTGTTYTIFNNPVSFTDVHHDWAVNQINALAARNILNGVGGSLFDPDRTVTRGEFIKMIVAMFDIYDSSAVANFADINGTEWYAPYVATAQSLGITNGYDDGTFRPNQTITREEMSTMLYRAGEKLSVAIEAKINKTTFDDDAAIQDYAKVCVYKMQQAQILQGVGNNMFDPQGNCTRAQAAVAAYNMFVLSMQR
jgi:hypothetical protein